MMVEPHCACAIFLAHQKGLCYNRCDEIERFQGKGSLSRFSGFTPSRRALSS